MANDSRSSALKLGSSSGSGYPLDAQSVSDSAYSSLSPAPVKVPKPLSCVTCRDRKVKCDKHNPCATCRRAGIECVFPDRTRVPKKKKQEGRKVNHELLQRLGKLEELVEKAGILNGPAVDVDENAEHDIGGTFAKEQGTQGSNELQDAVAEGRRSSSKIPSVGSGLHPLQETPSSAGVDADMNKYMGSKFWTSLTNEVEGLRQILNQDSDDEYETSPSNTSDAPLQPVTSYQGFVFGYNHSSPMDLRSLHPRPSHIVELCNIYIANVDPMFRLLHKPSLQRLMFEAKDRINSIPGGDETEALMFAVYFAAVTTMDSQDCMDRFQEDKLALVAKYRYGTEQALAKANFLNSTALATLQALLIFLLAARCLDDTRFVWTLTSLAVRIGQAMELYREGSVSLHSPFEAEMRRRLWYCLCVLDIRAAEDRGSEEIITANSFDTKIPANLNDEDIDPSMPQAKTENQSFTDMTFCLMIYEVSMATRRLNQASPNALDAGAALSPWEQEKVVLDCQERFEERYFGHHDESVPLCFVTKTVARLILSRMKMKLHNHLRRSLGPSSNDPTSVNIFLTAVESLEAAHSLEREPRVAQWRWFFGTFVPWHALAIVLAKLCVQTQGLLADRAWKVVDGAGQSWIDRVADSKNGTLWRPLNKLSKKAYAARESTIDPIRLTDENVPVGGMQGQISLQSMDFPLPTSGFKNLAINQPMPPNIAEYAVPSMTSQIAMNTDMQMMDAATVPQEYGAQDNPIDWAIWDEFMRESQNDQGLKLDQMGLDWETGRWDMGWR